MSLNGIPKWLAPALVIAVLISANPPTRGQAEPFGPSLTQAFLVGNGRFVIANYTGPFFVVWDLERIWDRLQPTQVLVYHGSGEDFNYAMRLTVSRNGQRLAFQDRDSDDVYVCEMRAPFVCRLALELERELITLALSPNGERLLLMDQTQIMLLTTQDSRLLIRKNPAKKSACLTADWDAGFAALGSLEGSVHLIGLKNLIDLREFQHAAADECQLYFTGSARRLISTWTRDVYDDYFINIEREAWNDPVGAPAAGAPGRCPAR